MAWMGGLVVRFEEELDGGVRVRVCTSWGG